MKITIKVRNAAGCRARASAYRVTAEQREAAGRSAYARTRRAMALRLEEAARRIEACERRTGKPHGRSMGAYGLIIEIPANAVVISTAAGRFNGVDEQAARVVAKDEGTDR